VEYQQIGAWWHGPLVSTDWFLFGGAGPGTLVVCGCRVVFGTLLGPEATGPGRVRLWPWLCPGCLFLVSWLHRLTRLSCVLARVVWGVWYGVVV
jgi:hypothetical protein